jgi:hypothetical protein
MHACLYKVKMDMFSNWLMMHYLWCTCLGSYRSSSHTQQVAIPSWGIPLLPSEPYLPRLLNRWPTPIQYDLSHPGWLYNGWSNLPGYLPSEMTLPSFRDDFTTGDLTFRYALPQPIWPDLPTLPSRITFWTFQSGLLLGPFNQDLSIWTSFCKVMTILVLHFLFSLSMRA